MDAEIIPFEEGSGRADPADETLVVDLEVYEGPIDVLLTLARDQKVDLTKMSILALADQYLAFIARAKRVRLEIAADYLVMAAWLAYLKSRLLLPSPPEGDEEPTAAEMAEALAFQLKRLQAMQEAGQALLRRPLLGRDVFARGAPEGVRVVHKPVHDASLYDLISAYGEQVAREERAVMRIGRSELYSMDAALERMRGLIGRAVEWRTLQTFLPPGLLGLLGRSALSAILAAGLEMVRTGEAQLRQDRAFGPVFLRRKPVDNVTELTPREVGR
jgi:segregation and condensation protein A